MLDRDHEHVPKSTEGQVSSRPNSVNLTTYPSEQTADCSTRSSKTLRRSKSIRENPVYITSIDPGHTIDGRTTLEVERCSLEMKNTESLEGESRGDWTTCILRLLIVEAKDKDPFKYTRLLELSESKDDSQRKIWQLCKCCSRFGVHEWRISPCRASTDVRRDEEDIQNHSKNEMV